MRFARFLLALSAATFATFGVLFLTATVRMAEAVEIPLPTATARGDFRATYGGFELGFAAFLAACLARREWVAPGLLASGLALAGFAAARGGSMLADGPVQPIMGLLLAAEVAAGVASFLGWRLAARHTDPPGA